MWAYQVRAELEGLAAAIATPRLSKDQLNRLLHASAQFDAIVAELSLAEVNRQAASDERRRAWTAANDEFHETLLHAGENLELVQAVNALHLRFPRNLSLRAIGDSLGLAKKNANEHTMIRLAVEAGDSERARVEMRSHVLSSGELVGAWLDTRSSGSI
jgi:DNA-binding GntR family transcriptional regulator